MNQFGTLYPHKITAHKELAGGVFSLRFDAVFPFQAGQVIALDLAPNDAPRLYSIASGEKDDFIEIFFDLRPGGKLTPQLAAMKPGDSVYLSEPFGNFTCDDKEAWWIAAGTGIAPFLSMIRSGKSAGKRLIHGGRMDENFYFSHLIEKHIAPENYIRCASQQADTLYHKGRLTNWLQAQPLLSKEIKYYLCGSAEMVVDVRDILIAKGVPFQQIISETYY